MQERIIEIIVYLMGEFQHQHSEENYVDLSEELRSRGYTENEINIAFSWIFNHLQKEQAPQKAEFQYSGKSIRVLHELEKLVVSPDAYGYLLQLWQLGILDESGIESAIEKSLSLGTTNITLDDIKSITASMVLGADPGNFYEGFFYQLGSNTIH